MLLILLIYPALSSEDKNGEKKALDNPDYF
jgi:hypothetical protein